VNPIRLELRERRVLEGIIGTEDLKIPAVARLSGIRRDHAVKRPLVSSCSC
jgi:hypothetical protein